MAASKQKLSSRHNSHVPNFEAKERKLPKILTCCPHSHVWIEVGLTTKYQQFYEGRHLLLQFRLSTSKQIKLKLDETILYLTKLQQNHY